MNFMKFNVIIASIGVCSDALSNKKRIKKLELEMEALEEVIEDLESGIKDNADDVQIVNDTIKKNDLNLAVLGYAVGGTIQDVENLDTELSMYLMTFLKNNIF